MGRSLYANGCNDYLLLHHFDASRQIDQLADRSARRAAE
jgi:hypothetical protein